MVYLSYANEDLVGQEKLSEHQATMAVSLFILKKCF